jgi:hypothetical protein
MWFLVGSAYGIPMHRAGRVEHEEADGYAGERAQQDTAGVAGMAERNGQGRVQ